jgi:hypothetical protein
VGGPTHVAASVEIIQLGIQFGNDALDGRLLPDHLVVEVLAVAVVPPDLLVPVIGPARGKEPFQPITRPVPFLLRPRVHGVLNSRFLPGSTAPASIRRRAWHVIMLDLESAW